MGLPRLEVTGSYNSSHIGAETQTQVLWESSKYSYPGAISPARMQYFQHLDALIATCHMKSDVEFSTHSIMVMPRKIQAMEHSIGFLYQGCLASSSIVILFPAEVKCWASECSQVGIIQSQSLRSYLVGSRMRERTLHCSVCFPLRSADKVKSPQTEASQRRSSFQTSVSTSCIHPKCECGGGQRESL